MIAVFFKSIKENQKIQGLDCRKQNWVWALVRTVLKNFTFQPGPSRQGKRRSLRVWGWGENCWRKRIAKTMAERRKQVSKLLLIRQLRGFGSLAALPGTPAPLGGVHRGPSAIAAARLWDGGPCCLPASGRGSRPCHSGGSSAKETLRFECFFFSLSTGRVFVF